MPKREAPRKYKEVWEKLKIDGEVLLSVPVVFMPRVKKAVIKEKYMDERFHILNKSKGFRLAAELNEAAKTIKFTLQQSQVIKSLGIDGKIRL